jgi:hypothetical protein
MVRSVWTLSEVNYVQFELGLEHRQHSTKVECHARAKGQPQTWLQRDAERGYILLAGLGANMATTGLPALVAAATNYPQRQENNRGVELDCNSKLELLATDETLRFQV